MKKLLALLLALVMCVSMFACGGEEKDTDEKDEETTVEADEKDEDEKSDEKDDEKSDEKEDEKSDEKDDDKSDDDKKETTPAETPVETPVVDEKTYTAEELEAPSATLEEALAKFKYELDVVASGDMEVYAAASGADVESLDPITRATIETMLKNFDYEMGAVVENGDAASVDVTITNVDNMALMFAMYAVYDENASEEELTAAVLNVVNGDVATFTETVTVYFDKTEEGWALDEYLNDDFANVVAGIPTTAEDDFGFGDIYEDVEAEVEATVEAEVAVTEVVAE